MATLNNKIDFVVLASVTMANANGDPNTGNRPRMTYGDFGEMSDVCIKRKIRNRMQDMDYKIFVQSEERCDDGCKSLKDRSDSVAKLKAINNKGKKVTFADKQEYAEIACDRWIDVRSFGQVFAFSGSESDDGVSIGIRGPVSIHTALSASPIDIHSIAITKSVNGNNTDKKKSSDTMGSKHFVRYGLYTIKGSINVQLAEKTGFSEEDAEVLKECLRTLFENDSSSARPDGSMEILKVFWFRHNCKGGQYSSAKVHRSIEVKLKNENELPTSADDYEIIVHPLEGLEPEVIDGV
ncbi:MAG: type I-C CRISPR-associated protein Cas7/Csd2 [Oscillospiraceae bacterium]|nr:type I-C CRISPR-associated protein Cas7/Csd2 [Oscillospiraceae bacterium]